MKKIIPEESEETKAYGHGFQKFSMKKVLIKVKAEKNTLTVIVQRYVSLYRENVKQSQT